MPLDPAPHASVHCSIAPWLSVRNSRQAVDFYASAFGATEVYHLDGGEKGVVARLSIDGAEFWLSDESPAHGNFSPESLGGGSVRMILTVPDPDAVFERALTAGATEIYSVSEGHGWRVGRVADAEKYGGVSGSAFVVYHGEINEDSDGPAEACVPVDVSADALADGAMRRESAHREA